MEKIGKKNINKLIFNKLRTPPEREAYLEDCGFDHIGEGSSRSVWIISSKKVIKLALNKAGVAQNAAEFEIAQSGGDFFPKVYDKAPDDSWIEVELARPAKSLEEVCDYFDVYDIDFISLDEFIYKYHGGGFEEFLKSDCDTYRKQYEEYLKNITNSIPIFDESDFEYLVQLDQTWIAKKLKQKLLENKNNFSEDEYDEYVDLVDDFEASDFDVLKEEVDKTERFVNNKKITKFIDSVYDSGLVIGDCLRYENLGFGVDGRLVIIDFGFTPDVRSKHYSYEPTKNPNFDYRGLSDTGYKSRDPKNIRALLLNRLYKKANKFNKDILNGLNTVSEKLNYLNNECEFLGEGSSRASYLVNDKVLKLAINKVGLEQNKTEFEICSSGKNDVFIKTYDKANDYSWIEVEYANMLDVGLTKETLSKHYSNKRPEKDLGLDFSSLKVNSIKNKIDTFYKLAMSKD